jgi:hypothetical protein
MKIALLILLSAIAYGADSLTGTWDFIKEEKIETKIKEGRSLILEGVPDKTHIEFNDGMYGHYRNGSLSYQMPYRIKSQDGSIIVVEIGSGGMISVVNIFLKDGILHGKVMGLKDVEYVYKRRG